MAVMIAVAITFHYWALGQLLRLIPEDNKSQSHFWRSLSILMLLFLVHVIEISWYTLGMKLATDWLHLGRVGLHGHQTWMDYFYYAASTYSTLGLSEMPIGHLKIITGLTSLSGFILITWSATFFYTIMGRKPE
jgi:hypothetical protein